MNDVFDALAHPARRALLDELRCGPARAGDLGTGLAISREAVSKHLRVLVAGGALSVQTRGRERWYELDPTALQSVDDWLDPYRDAWAQRLDALETEVARGRRRHAPTQTPPAPEAHQYSKGA